MKKLLIVSIILVICLLSGCVDSVTATITDPVTVANTITATIPNTVTATVPNTVTVTVPSTVTVTSPNPIPATVTNTVTVTISGVTPNDTGIISVPYYYAIADGKIANHVAWSKIGYNGSIVANTLADVWSAGGLYVFPTAAAGMEVVSSDNTQDIGSIIFSGNSDGGTTTTLVDSTKNFTAGTAVAIGDCIVLDKSGTTPEWGYVTAVAATTLTCSGGFSSGGTGNGRIYEVIDKSAYTGAQAVRVTYLNGSYAEDTEIIILNGTTVVPTVQLDLFRVNSFRVVAVGSNNGSVGNIVIRNLADTPNYSYISAGYTQARNIVYTVPAGKTLFVSSATWGYAYASNSTHYARLFNRANVDNLTGFNTDGVFYPFTEVVCSNSTVVREFEVPSRLSEKTDLRVMVLADFAGIAEVALRGWLETN